MTYIPNYDVESEATQIDYTFTKEAITSTVEDYPGTTTTYTPEPNASAVVVEAQFGFSWNPDASSSLACTRLQYSTDSGSTWTDYDPGKTMVGELGSVSDYVWFNARLRYVLSPWTGSRQLRLAGRSYNTSTEYTVGRSYYTYNVEGNGTAPSLHIYSVV